MGTCACAHIMCVDAHICLGPLGRKQRTVRSLAVPTRGLTVDFLSPSCGYVRVRYMCDLHICAYYTYARITHMRVLHICTCVRMYTPVRMCTHVHRSQHRTSGARKKTSGVQNMTSANFRLVFIFCLSHGLGVRKTTSGVQNTTSRAMLHA